MKYLRFEAVSIFILLDDDSKSELHHWPFGQNEPHEQITHNNIEAPLTVTVNYSPRKTEKQLKKNPLRS